MKLWILRIYSFFDGDSVAQCTRCQELKYFRQHFTIYYNQVFWQPRPDTNYITSILETRVDSRVSTGVKFGSKRVSKFRDKHCQLPLFPEHAHWADICLVEPEKGPQNGQKWANVDFEWGFFNKPHDFYDFYVWFLSQYRSVLYRFSTEKIAKE